MSGAILHTFGVQQKIYGYNGYANRNNAEDDEYKQHESVNIVEFIIPEGSKDEIHLNEY